MFAFHVQPCRNLQDATSVNLRSQGSHDGILENLRKFHRPESLDYVTKVLDVEDLRERFYAPANTITPGMPKIVFWKTKD